MHVIRDRLVISYINALPGYESKLLTTNVQLQVNKSSTNGRNRIWHVSKLVTDFFVDQ